MTYRSGRSGSSRRRSPLPFIVAAVLAVALIVGLRFAFAGGGGGGGDKAHACGHDRVRLRIAASQDKVGLLQEAVKGYNGRTVAGHCAEVEVASVNSGSAMVALARGWNEATDGPRPDVWSPAGSAWVTLERQRAARSDRPSVVPDGDQPSIMSSPLTIAMPKPMAEALGWPGKSLGWSDLLALANDPKGWARYGHPEWGRFKLGKTNPNFSTSGLNATIAAYFASTGTTSDLTAKDVKSARATAFVRGVERSIVHYGDITMTFLSNLQRADDRGAALSYISAVTVEEDSVYNYNQGNPQGDPANAGRHAKPRTPLVAIYPKEGTMLSDHPFVPLTWIDPVKKQIAADLLNYLHGPRAQAVFARYGFRDHQDRPGAFVTRANGLDPAQPKTLLHPPAPAVLDGLLRQWSSLRKPANVLLVVDRSGSMGDEAPGTGRTKMDLAKQAAITSLAQFADRDRVGLWAFSSGQDGAPDYTELVPIGPMRTTREAIRSRLQGLAPEGGTGLYDTTAAAYEKLKAASDPEAINAVVVLTDGRNEKNGGRTLGALLGELRGEEGPRVFTIAYGKDADQSVLRQISQATDAAEYDSSSPGSIDQVFTNVISNF